MAQDLLTTYKLGWKTSYYQNTYDAKKDGDEEDEKKLSIEEMLHDILNIQEEDDCDSCKI
jgi:ribonucleoside-diphosphate reductase alpha chain